MALKNIGGISCNIVGGIICYVVDYGVNSIIDNIVGCGVCGIVGCDVDDTVGCGICGMIVCDVGGRSDLPHFIVQILSLEVGQELVCTTFGGVMLTAICRS